MYKKAVCLSDQHLPFEDKKANQLVFKFLSDFKPDTIYLLGDLIDFWQISKFLITPQRKLDLQKDIDKAKVYLTQLRDLCPNADISLHYGNHLDRLRKYIWVNAKALHDLRSLDLDFMLGTDTLKIRTIKEAQGYEKVGYLCLTHGTVVSQDSAMTARRNLQKYGLSVICGHTHRLGSTYKTDLRGMIGAWENGCLCDLKLVRQWGNELANWQTGFSILFFTDHRFQVQQIPIIKNKMMFGEKEYGLETT